MIWKPKTDRPKPPSSLLRRGAIPVALTAALGTGFAVTTLEQFEGNINRVYADKLAGGIPTYCAGRTDWKAPVGATITTDDCKAVNLVTVWEYGYAVLDCTKWGNLSGYRLIALTMFAVNVGKVGACKSRAVQLINAGAIEEGCRAIAFGPAGQPVWAYAGGVYVQGLHNRRKAEAGLCAREEVAV
jgi:lysozyme